MNLTEMRCGPNRLARHKELISSRRTVATVSRPSGSSIDPEDRTIEERLELFAGSSTEDYDDNGRVSRIGWLLLTLLQRPVDFAEYTRRFACGKREFQRDLKALRTIGGDMLTIPPIHGGRAMMQVRAARLMPFASRSKNAEALLARIGAALGGPIGSALSEAAPEATAAAAFLHLREPRPSMGETLAHVCAFIEKSASGPARVEFAYTARNVRSVRRVEPYHVIARSGRYYLVAYDLGRRAWRTFALDAIDDRSLRREGTFAPRAVPARLLADRAVGWIGGNAADVEVTLRASPVVAAAVRASQWQEEQCIVARPDGSIELTMRFDDLGEAVRWSLRFGAEATIVAPPQAVALARETARQILVAYDGATMYRERAG